MFDTSQALQTAMTVARGAGDLLVRAHEKLLREGSASLQIHTKSSARDFVTQIDKAVQEFVVGELVKAYPDHRFIAEEEGADKLGKTDCPYIWIVDPLDGTTNFIHGKTAFGTMIALMNDTEFVLGVIYLPLSQELFSAERGKGAFRNGKPVKLRQAKDLNDAILSTNLSMRTKPCSGQLHVPLIPCGSIHNYGCAAEEMGEILRGGNDGLFYEGVGLWDIAPGCLMIEEAGGRVRWEFRDPKNPRAGVNAVVGTREIFGEVERCVFGKHPSVSP